MSSTSPESLEAFTSGDKDHLRALALDYIRGRREHGATADESCEALGMLHNSIAPRLVELESAGLIIKLHDSNGKRVRRETRQGCMAGVYVSTEFAPEPCRSPMLFDLTPDDDAPARHLDLG